MSKPYIEVEVSDYSGDGYEFHTYVVTDVVDTDQVEEGDTFTYSELCRLADDGIDFEVIGEECDYEY